MNNETCWTDEYPVGTTFYFHKSDAFWYRKISAGRVLSWTGEEFSTSSLVKEKTKWVIQEPKLLKPLKWE